VNRRGVLGGRKGRKNNILRIGSRGRILEVVVVG
jgi:hypothetical protein